MAFDTRIGGATLRNEAYLDRLYREHCLGLNWWRQVPDYIPDDEVAFYLMKTNDMVPLPWLMWLREDRGDWNWVYRDEDEDEDGEES